MKSKNPEQIFSDPQKEFILLSFTKELMQNSGKNSVAEIENPLKKKPKEKIRDENDQYSRIIEKIKAPEKRHESLKNYSREKIPLSPQQNELVEALKFSEERSLRRFQQLGKNNLPALRIPMQKLPPRFQYLKPVPTNDEIDLEKLNPLLKDPMVRIIECNGVNKNIIVGGAMGRKKTPITLSRKEIEKIVYKFSEAAKIPFHEGIFKVAVGRLIFTSIVSEIVDSKFIIKKMMLKQKPGV